MIFALAFVLLGWTAGHAIAYEVVGLGPHDHDAHHDPMHAYFGGLKLAGGVGLVVAFGLALRTFFRHGSFGEWLHEGGASGTRGQISLAATLPALTFVVAEYSERLAAGAGTAPPVRLLVAGVLVQAVVGLLCLALARLAFRVTERVIRSFSRRTRPGRPPVGPSAPVFAPARPSCPMAGSAAGRAPPTPLPLR